MHHVAALPKQGVLVSGASLAGVRLGDTMASVKALWGGHFTRCGSCKPAMWFFFYPPPQDPVGAGVEFQNGKVVAVFTLGGPAGWHTETGIKVGEILSNQFDGKSNEQVALVRRLQRPADALIGQLRDVDPHAGRGCLRLRADPAVRLALPLSYALAQLRVPGRAERPHRGLAGR